MPQPHFTLTITASAVAWYAAIVATASTLIQTANYMRDRKKLRLRLLRRMSSNRPHEVGTTFTLLIATNSGRRPVNLTHVYIQRADNRADILVDTRPPLPCELTEGKEFVARLNEEGADFPTIQHFAVIDSTGRIYKLHLTPWRKRTIETLRRRLTRKAHT